MAIHYRDIHHDPLVERHVEDEMLKLEKYLLKAHGGGQDPRCEVKLQGEHGRIVARVVFRSKGGRVAATGAGRSPSEAVTNGFHKIGVQLKKRKEKYRERPRIRAAAAV